MNKNILYLLYFTVYSLILLFFGKSGFKKTNNASDFFVAGNSFGLAISLFTFAGTWFSAASMQGVTGSVFSYGYSTVLYSVLPWFFGAILLMILAPKLRTYDILTLPEFFYLRYDSKWLQAMGGLMIVITYTHYIIIQVRGFGIVISELLDINYLFASVLVYIFIIYTSFGGLFSVAKTDGLNIILVSIGVVVAAMLILNEVGGIGVMMENAASINTRPFPEFPHITEKGGLLDPFAKGQMPPIVTFTSLFGWGLGLASNPQYTTRIMAAKSNKVAVKMIWQSVILLTILYLGLIIIGMGGRVLVPTIEAVSTVDEVFPYLVNNVIDSPLSGFILISMAAAAISTANSQLVIAASGLTYDFYKNLINSNIKEEHFLNLNRLFIFLIGTVSLIMAIKPPDSLLVYGGYIWGFYSASFLIPLYGGVFWKKSTKEGAISAFIVGLISIIFFITKDLNSMIHPAMPSVFASAATFYFVSKYFYNKANR